MAAESSLSQMSVDFWQVDSGKEDIWSKLKVIEIFEITNILLMSMNVRIVVHLSHLIKYIKNSKKTIPLAHIRC